MKNKSKLIIALVITFVAALVLYRSPQPEIEADLGNVVNQGTVYFFHELMNGDWEFTYSK